MSLQAYCSASLAQYWRNRVPALIVAMARRWLAIPVQNFLDDSCILDIDKSNQSANIFSCLLTEQLLGFRVDSSKEQNPILEQYFSATWKHTKWTMPATQR